MKKHFLVLTILLLLPALTFAQTKLDMVAIQEVEVLERQRFAAQVAKDYTFLGKVFADDLVYIHASGHQDTKTSYLQSIRDGKSQYDKIDVEALNVRLYNDDRAAVVNGTVVITSPAKADGRPSLARLKYAVIHIKVPRHGWQVVLWQAQKQL
ncbi:nuclear transport factor 2 family protein [Hymenobacter sp.]|uniref:nuclear transport factor 2 family protein n=1 Tax=Hymenobacter sp. TaxID=1898978 RepID=UPI00286C6663|nr:nuclear transport factor 2 family protein [Hymenobacter sp.]